MLKNLKPFTTPQLLFLPRWRQKNFYYTPIPINRTKSFMLDGYFQTEKYFKKEYQNIIRLIGLRKQQKLLYKKEKKTYFAKPTISLHFRLGDFVKLSDYHPVISLNYYINALNFIVKKTNQIDWNVIYFCEEQDNEIIQKNISIIQEKNPSLCFIKANDKLQDWEQLLLMSCCQHNIIANSTFSWWGAYFNENNEKIVCCPDVWMGEKNIYYGEEQDLIPPEWFKIFS